MKKKLLSKNITQKSGLLYTQIEQAFSSISLIFCYKCLFFLNWTGQKLDREKNKEKKSGSNYYPTLELKVLPILNFFSLSDSTSADAKYLEGSTYSSSKSVQGESRAAARVFRFPGNSTGPLMIYWNDYKSLFGINLSLSLMALRWQIFFIQKSAKSA